jgi:hypothetical protein
MPTDGYEANRSLSRHMRTRLKESNRLVTFLIYNRQAVSSNLGQDTDYSD